MVPDPKQDQPKLTAYTAPKKATRKTKQGEDSLAGAEDLEASAPEWLLAKEAAEAVSEEGSFDSDSPEESDEEEERGPAITSTVKKDKRKERKKNRDSGIATVVSQLMSKAMEQRGKNYMEEVADTLLNRIEKSKSTKRKGE